MKPPEPILSAATQLRTYHAVCVIGAGTSLSSGLPLTDDLRNLLWTAFDADPVARRALAARLNRADTSAKRLIAQNQIATEAAWTTLAAHPNARRGFQRSFSELDSQRGSTPSSAHSALAELLHRRVIEMVVSLNWDTLLEKAHSRRYGTAPLKGWLFKPHGDAAKPERPWLLPHEAGQIPDSVIREIQRRTSGHPRVLLIVGYSECDEEIVRKLIQPAEDQWHVIRIGPNAKGYGSVSLAAAEALSQLVKALGLPPEVPGWEYVTFQHQRGLESAITGNQLGPSDVEACPACEEVAAVRKRLTDESCMWLLGESGSGKSLAAYQALFALSREGWEILRLNMLDTVSEEILIPLNSLPRPTVLLIDDAERLPENLRRRLTEIASAAMPVLFCSSGDGPANSSSVRLDPRGAVKTIHAALAAKPNETLAAVRRIDSQVGDALFDTPLDSRLTEAAEAEVPWQFMFTLGAGWRRARAALADIRKDERLDELLIAIAARQLVMLDAPVDKAWLEEAASILGHDYSWAHRGVAILKKRRLLIGQDEVRCAHRRFAAVVLALCGESVESIKPLIPLCRAALSFRDPPLRGISWLLHELRMTDTSDYLRAGALLDDSLLDAIHARCFETPTGVARRDALFALEAMLDWQPRDYPRLGAHRQMLSHWLTQIDPEECAAYGSFLNQLRQRNRWLVPQIIRGANPKVLAHAVSKASVASFGLWGKLLGEFWSGGTRWRTTFGGSLRSTHLRRQMMAVRREDVWKLSLFLAGITKTNPELALKLTRTSLGTLVQALHRDPAGAFTAMDWELLWRVLNYYPQDYGRTPNRSQAAVAAKLVRLLNPQLIARRLKECPRRQWEAFAKLLFFIRRVSPQRHQEIVNAIDLKALNSMTAGLWSDVPTEVEALLRAFSIGKDCGRAREWLTMNAEEVQRVRPILVVLAPTAMAQRIRAGAAVDLQVSRGHEWLFPGCAILSLREIDQAMAKRVVDESLADLAAGFSHLQRLGCEHFPIFCKLLDEVSPHIFSKVSPLLEIEPARKLWPSLAKGKAVERRALKAVVERLKPIPSEFRSLHRRMKLLVTRKK